MAKSRHENQGARGRKITYHDSKRAERLHISGKTQKQNDYIHHLFTSDQVIVMGPAGTGKTFLAASVAASLYHSGRIDKIVLTRPNVSSSRSLGAFPGTLEEKMAPWTAPVVDVLRKRLGEGALETMVRNGNLEVRPFETMRGASFENAFVLLDEAQNATPHEMKMFVTRIGEGTKVIINGDVTQSDLPARSGLALLLEMNRRYNVGAAVVEFGVEDIVRSDMCKRWIMAFMEEERF